MLTKNLCDANPKVCNRFRFALKKVEMEQNHNPALVHMEVAQDEIATYAMLLSRAQSSLTASWQAFERANENSLTHDCPVRKQITQNLREHYTTLISLTEAIIKAIAAPTLSRMISTAPNRVPGLVSLLDCLPEEERKLITIALTCLLQAEGEGIVLSEEQVFLAASILYTLGKSSASTI